MRVKYERTKFSNIVRAPSETLFLRAKVCGRKIFRSLKTRSIEIAIRKRDEILDRERAYLSIKNPRVQDDVTVRQLVEEYLSQVDASERRQTTKHDMRKSLAAFEKTVPDCLPSKAVDVTEVKVTAWMEKLRNKYSAGHHNRLLGILKNAMKIGVECGLWRSSPAKNVKVLRVVAKERDMPTQEQLAALFEYLKNRHQNGSYYLARFLCYSGFRLRTATALTPANVSREAGVFLVPGERLKTGDNGRVYRFPIFPKMAELLDELDRDFGKDRERLLPIKSCWRALNKACEKLEMPSLNHHAFRHVFTTNALEAGVPVPIVAAWRGDKDGGRTLLRVYWHLIDQTSKKFAAQVQMP